VVANSTIVLVNRTLATLISGLMEPIFRLKLKFDLERLRGEISRLEEDIPFEKDCQQIALTHRPLAASPFYDGVGSLYDLTTGAPLGEESDFFEFNAKLNGWYIHEVYKTIKSEFPELGRVRLMGLRPKSCLSVHRDTGFRLHVPIVSGKQCFMIYQDSGLVHMPADGHAYLADTIKPHSAMNGHADFRRVHMVFSINNADAEYFEQTRERLGLGTLGG